MEEGEMPMYNSIPKIGNKEDYTYLYTRNRFITHTMQNRKIIPYILLLCLTLIGGCRKAPLPPNTPEGEISAIYTELRKGYGGGDTATAISMVRRMLSFPIPADETKALHIRTLNNGLLQLMYCYIYGENPGEGFSYFLRLINDTDPSLSFPAECKRQILILTSYLGMLNGELPQAVEYLEKGLQLPEPPTPDERYADYTFAAAIYSQTKGGIDQSIHMYEKALAEIRLSKDQSGLPWILGNLAELYDDHGDFEKAVQMYYESLDLFKATNDQPGISETYTSLSELYRRWGMTEQAEMYADKGLKHARLSGYGYNIGFSMLQKYEIAEMRQQNDSALYWLQCADSCFVASNSPVEHLSAQGFITRLLLRDSTYLEEGTKRLEQICKDSLISQTLYEPILQQLLGECYLLLGRKQEGIQLINSVLPQLEEAKKDVILLEIYRTLIRFYRQEKEYEKALVYEDKANELQEELFKNEKLHQVTASRVYYETTQKELENKILQQKVELKQHTLTFTWILVGLLGTLLVFGGLYVRQRHRYLRRISDARLSQISGLLQAQQELNQSRQELSQQNESLTHELHKASDELQKTSRVLDEVSSELQDASKRKAIATIRREISTKIFNSDKEAEFRRSFTAIYADYLPALHKLNPELTRTDELIAMLLALELSSDEIALTLGISKNGVNKARSRMRKRLGLNSEINLEEFLKGILD